MSRPSSAATADGTRGWDEYARYYDWENARTIGARDVAFWQELVADARGPVIELGCGTGRVLMKTSAFVFDRRKRKRPPRLFSLIGIDRSAPMLDIARRRARRLRAAARPGLIRGDIRALPVASGSIDLVIAPYGILQSLVHDLDLARVLSEAGRVLRPGGGFVADLVPDLPQWPAYRSQVRIRGRRGRKGTITLVETVRQDRRRGLTIFDETFVERAAPGPKGRRPKPVTRQFSITFRTLPFSETRRRLVRAGFDIDAVSGGYQGQPWTPFSETWVIRARKR